MMIRIATTALFLSMAGLAGCAVSADGSGTDEARSGTSERASPADLVTHPVGCDPNVDVECVGTGYDNGGGGGGGGGEWTPSCYQRCMSHCSAINRTPTSCADGCNASCSNPSPQPT